MNEWLLIVSVSIGAIKRKIELDWGTEDVEYLQLVELHCEGTLNEIRPDIIIYNAGTDILDGDPLGGLAISPQVQKQLGLYYFKYLNSMLNIWRSLWELGQNYCTQVYESEMCYRPSGRLMAVPWFEPGVHLTSPPACWMIIFMFFTLHVLRA